MTNKPAPVHPGEVLLEDLLVPMNLSGGAFARVVRVPSTVYTSGNI